MVIQRHMDEILVVTMILKRVHLAFGAIFVGGGRGEYLTRVIDFLQFLGQFHTTENFHVTC